MPANFSRISACLSLALLATVAGAEYPDRAVRFVVGFTPGGPSDIVARLLGHKLAEAWGQQVVIDNRAGAGGNIAAELVAKSAGDGYTLLLGNNSILATNAALYAKLNFDPVRDFAPVVLVASQPNILVVHPSLPVKSVKELIALAKAKPGQLNYASSGSGAAAHLSGELFKAMAHVDLVHIPYKGAAPALNDVLAGQDQLMFATSLSVMPHIQSGRARALAVTTPKRHWIMAELPTMAESGYPKIESTFWLGVVAPAGTPAAIVERLNAAFRESLAAPETRERLKALGADAAIGTPEEFRLMLADELALWTSVAKAANLQMD